MRNHSEKKADEKKVKKPGTKKQVNHKRRLSVILAVLIVVLLAANWATVYYEVPLTVALSGSAVDEEAQSKALEAGYALNVELAEEGFVLLKNENNTLPVDVSAGAVKVNVFGLSSANLVLNSAGSASGSTAEAVGLKESLEAAGFEVNSSLWELISSTTLNRNTSVNEGGSSEAVVELGVDEYTGDCSFESAKAYSEYAIVAFSRIGGEGADQDRTGMGADGSLSYLELADSERALLEKLNEEDFTTIVLINSSYAMELGVLDEYDVEAALWIGGPGVKGATAIGEILSGAVNPSGRLVDTYAYDLTTAASYVGSGNYQVLDTAGEQIGGYTQYLEDIYVGYKWYETADAESFWSSDYAKERWGVSSYEEVVQYPFGYGLSYTEFETAYAGTPVFNEESGTIDFSFRVKNTGSVPGKEVVQLYVETPYENGSVEKSKVSLCAFGKTQELAAGEETELTLQVALEDIASYDEMADGGAGAYVLAQGSYYFYLSENAHSWASIDTKDTTKCYTYTLGNAVVYGSDNNRSSDQEAASNKLDELAVMNGERIVTLSRKDGFANAADTAFAELSNITVNGSDPLYKALVDEQSEIGAYEGEVWSDLTVGARAKYSLSDLTDKEKGYTDYEDERWETLISQMSVEDMVKLVGTGGWSTAEIESVSKERTSDIDGPFGLSNLIKNSMGTDVKCVSYCTEVVMASTWNEELLTRVGEAVAAEAQATGVSGWYAPGANIHRTPFGGRNPEYYSEDSYLSGRMCAAEASGALSKGLYVYVKHFAFNDVEANRTYKENCYLTEQTAREIYLKPFEMAVKNWSRDEEGNLLTYGATGLMASYMWAQEQWVGGNSDLMTGILRDEWGFNGMVITDNAGLEIVSPWITLSKSIYAGTDLMLVYRTGTLDASIANSDVTISALKTASKHILYTIADASSRRAKDVSGATNWLVIIRVSVSVVLGLGILFTLYRLIRQWRKKSE